MMAMADNHTDAEPVAQTAGMPTLHKVIFAGSARRAGRAAVPRLSGLRDEGDVLCALRRGLQPAPGLRRAAVFRACRLFRRGELCRRPCRQGLGPDARTFRPLRYGGGRACWALPSGRWRSAGRASTLPWSRWPLRRWSISWPCRPSSPAARTASRACRAATCSA